jgi:hypothetical protein
VYRPLDLIVDECGCLFTEWVQSLVSQSNLAQPLAHSEALDHLVRNARRHGDVVL